MLSDLTACVSTIQKSDEAAAQEKDRTKPDLLSVK
jgi:hypothetical protein